MQIDRGFIKWLPFNSVINPKELIKEIKKEKKYQSPMLCEERLIENEHNLLNAYESKSIIKIVYFKNNNFFKVTSKIQYLDSINKKIILDNNSKIYFSQIIYTDFI